MGKAGKQISNKIKDFADLTDFLLILLAVVSLVVVLAYLRLGLARVFYPYALDLVEEGMVMQAWRVAQGLPVFVPPNAEFVPQVYMPLFTWLGGLLMRLTGFGFWPLRLISFMSVGGTAVLIFIVGWRESGSKTAAFVGSGLFLGGYRLVGGWYDLARVDALFAFLCLVGLVLLRRGTQSYTEESPRGREIRIIFGAVLLGLAFLTKQNGLLLAAVAGFYFFTMESAEDAEKKRKSAFIRVLLLFIVPFGIVAVVPVLVLQELSRGWFSYYVVTIAYASPLDLGRLRNIFLWELGAGTGVLVAGTGVLVVQQVRRLEIGDWRLFVSKLQSLISQNPWLLFVGTAVFISIAGRSTVGGNLNNMLIGYAFLCLVPALSFPRKRESIPAQNVDTRLRGYETRQRVWIVAMLVQFGLVTFPLNAGLPQNYWPTAEMQAAGDALVERVAAEPGEVWLLMHPSVAVRAGKRPYAHLQSLWHARQRGVAPLPSDFVALIEQQQFAQIISDESDFFETEPAFLELLTAHYEVLGTLPQNQSPPTLNEPVIRPLTIYIPKE